MRSPNQHHCNTEVLITYTKVFLPTPGRTRGFIAAKAPKKKNPTAYAMGFYVGAVEQT